MKHDYFKQAKSWADDIYTQQTRSKARYQAGFLISMGLNMVAIAAIFTLSKLQTLVPILVHHYDNGITTVEPITKKNAPDNAAQIESDIVRYVINRESYDISSYRAQYDLIGLLSSASVANEYVRAQQARNPDSPIVTLNSKTSRKVHVYSVNFLDNVLKNAKDLHKNHQNLAEVVFTLTDVNKATGAETSQSYNALVSWQYVTPSESPAIRWQNFDGFEVTSYSKHIRNNEQK